MTHPIDEYVEALEAYRDGQPDAAQKVTQALGGTAPTEPIKSSLAKIFDSKTPLHEGVLRVLMCEARKRGRDV